MTSVELVKYVTDLLTGGGFIPLNVKPEVVASFVTDALERVTPYYKEKAVIETKQVIPASSGPPTSGYIELSSFAFPVHIVEKVYPTVSPITGVSFLQEMAGLLGLERSIIIDHFAVDYAMWTQVRRDLIKAVGRDLRFRLVRQPTMQRLFVDDAPAGMRVSVVYAPLPSDLSEVTWGPAITWVKDWVIAMTEISQAKVMGRVGPETLGFTLNTADMTASGEKEKERLLALLPDLHFSYSSARK